MSMNIDLKLGECITVMSDIPDSSVDMVLCDLPYGLTTCAWDAIIPFDKLWSAYARIVKDDGAIVLTATQPFSSALVMSNPSWFRHEWIWEKGGSAGFQLAKYRPLQQHEHVLVFGKKSPRYYPIVEKRDAPCVLALGSPSKVSPLQGGYDGRKREYFYKHPTSILAGGDVITVDKKRGANYHPSEKPVPLLAYLVQTYSRRGDTVLDNTMGSGSTGVACIDESRNFIGIEMSAEYYSVARDRIEKEKAKVSYCADSSYWFGTDSEGVLVSKMAEESKAQPTLFGGSAG